MQRKWKRRCQRLMRLVLPPVAAGMLFFSSYSPLYAAPAGGTITSGSAAIAANGATTTITQISNKAAINWQSFNIAKGETVNFVQPSASSVALNRVVGNNASSIFGTLSANGKVFLINPSGILFAPGSQVSVGGLVASTLTLSDSDFLNGKYTWQKDGSAGSVINQGTITATNEAVLIGSQAANEGVIAAKVTGLAAGNTVSLDFSGDNLLNVAVDTGAVGGSASNTGTITSAGGLVVMTAGTKNALLHTVVNNSGVIRAQSVHNENGVIRLEGSTVVNAGTLNASGKTAGQTGGIVKLLGDTVIVKAGSIIDVSGDAGGGTALIGGNYQGSGSEYQAANTTVENNVVITADAITRGSGGQVVVWAKDTTTFAGTISAKGGSQSGDGGSVETSGKQTLKVADSAKVITTAANGKRGNWLLDPDDFTIGAGGDIDTATLQDGLEYANITIMTTATTSSATDDLGNTYSTGATGSGQGNITLIDPLTWASGNTLTLSAYNNINLNASITATSGGLTLAANTSGNGNGIITGIIKPASTSSISVGTFTLQSGTWQEVNSSLSSFYAKDFRLTGGTFIRMLGGSGTSANPYQIADAYGLQGIGSAGMLGNSYILANTIDASSTSTWNSYVSGSTTKYYGFAPIGNDTTPFTGTLDGLGHTITSLTISRSSAVGLFGQTSATATLRNIGLVDGSINGGGCVGGLVGYNYGTIESSYNTGNASVASVLSSNNTFVGGLVGYNYGTIEDSYNTASVTSSAISLDTYSGGLVGINRGTIRGSYNTGNVSASSSSTGYYTFAYAGGLAGKNYGTIAQNYNTGDVSSTATSASTASYAGGLAGLNDNGIIEYSYNTGVISASSVASNVAFARGLTVISTGTGTITDCYYATTDAAGNLINATDSYNNYGGKKTLDELKRADTFSTWGSAISATGDSSSVWRIYDSYTTPLLRSFLTPVTVTGATKTYDGQISGTASSYTLDSAASLSGSLSYTTASKNAGTYSTASSTLTLNGLYSGQQGYDISYAPATLTINRAVLTVDSLTAASKVYDRNTSTTVSGTLTGIISGDTVTLGGGSFANKNAGNNKAVTVILAGADAANYSLEYSPITADITPAALIITAAGVNKIYNGTKDASVSFSDNRIAGDVLTVTGSAAFNDKNAGNGKAVNVSGISLSGADAANYTYNTTAATTADIAKATLTVSNLAAANKIYDGNNTATVSGTLTGLLGSDAVTLGSGSFSDKNAGNSKTVTISTLTGADAINYTLAATTTADITPAALIVSNLMAANKTYDGTTNVSVSGTLNGVLGSDAVTLGGGSFNNKNAGTGKTVTVSTLTGSDSINYTMQSATTTADIAQASLTITANSASKVYNGQAYSGGNGVTYTGFVNGENQAALSGTLTFGGTAQGALTPGTYALTVSGLASTNYAITYQPSVLTITGRMSTPAYDGAVIHAGHTALSGSNGQLGSRTTFPGPLSGYLTGAAGTYAPLTIVGPGINLGGYPAMTGPAPASHTEPVAERTSP